MKITTTLPDEMIQKIEQYLHQLYWAEVMKELKEYHMRRFWKRISLLVPYLFVYFGVIDL